MTDNQTTPEAAGEWGRAIFETAKASVDNRAFGDAWRTYSANSGFVGMSAHDRALIRVAFVAGWRREGISMSQSQTTVCLPRNAVACLASLRVEGDAIMLRRFNVRIATFAANTRADAEKMAGALYALAEALK